MESRSKAAGYVNSHCWKKGEPWLHMASYSYKMLRLPMALFLVEALTPLQGWASLVNTLTFTDDIISLLPKRICSRFLDVQFAFRA